MKFSLEEIALHVDGTVLGDSSIQISEVAEIQNARVGSITFLSNQMYNKYLNTTEASAIFVSEEKLIQNRNGILVENPHLAMINPAPAAPAILVAVILPWDKAIALVTNSLGTIVGIIALLAG